MSTPEANTTDPAHGVSRSGNLRPGRLDLTTNYLGRRLTNPLVAGASPMSRSLGSVRALEDAGIAAVVVYSVFQEQIEHTVAMHEHFEVFGTDAFPEALTYMPSAPVANRGPDEYAGHVAAIKRAVDIPVFASLNGGSLGGWIEYARTLEQAGVDGLELNVYHVAADPDEDAESVESRYVDILNAVKATVSLPIALKIGPYFSSLANFARRLDQAGADGLVLFNRFYQPNIDLETLDVVSDLAFSAPHEMRLPLRWIAILDPIVEANLAATSGIYTASDVLKLLTVGADVTMLVAALLRNGPDVVRDILAGMERWMIEHEYVSVHQMQGSMNHRTVSAPSAFERSNYMTALLNYQ